MQNSPENTSPATHTAGHLNIQDRTVYMLRPVEGGHKGEGENIWYATVYGGATASEAELDANAYRLQVCWNACEGIPTEKIENRSIAEYVAGEAYINDFNLDETGLEFQIKGIACQMLAASFAGQFNGTGAINYLQMQMHHPEMGPFSVVIQRKEGKTPAEKSAELAKEIYFLNNKIVELEKFQKTVNELKQYFTSNNGVPVEKTTIKAKDFWRIIGQSDTAAHPRKFEIEKELLGVIKQFVKIYGDGEVEEQDEDEEVPNQWYDEQCEAAMRNARAVLKKYEPQI